MVSVACAAPGTGVSRWARVCVVLMLVLLGHLGPGSPAAQAAGFDCKEPPTPELPKAAAPSLFDSSSIERALPDHVNPTGYQSYGWAGLGWHTYDLGCGEDLVRAPFAVLDTNDGNEALLIGESLAAAAFWLDDQTTTGTTATESGADSALAEFDRIVSSVSQNMFGLYSTLIGIGLVAAAAVMAWQALKSDTAGVTKSVGVALVAMALGALLVGAPQKAIQISDQTFGAVITDIEEQMFSFRFDDGAGSLTDGAYDPRNVLVDRILLDDWRKGWFGAGYTEEQDRQYEFGLKLRDALAFTYEQQNEIRNDPDAEERIVAEKKDIFVDEVVKPLEEHGLSFHQFQGKTLDRRHIGMMAMLKLALPSLLWTGASLLKLTALLAIRFAILLAPIWVPIAIAHGGLLSRVLRTLATAYMWGVAASVIVGLYLMALVQIYVTDNDSLDGAWQLWFMVILTVICWCIMRPFKRITQTLSGNNASMVNRKGRVAKMLVAQALLKRGGRRARAGAGAGAGGVPGDDPTAYNPPAGGAPPSGGAGGPAPEGPTTQGPIPVGPADGGPTISGGASEAAPDDDTAAAIPTSRPEGNALADFRRSETNSRTVTVQMRTSVKMVIPAPTVSSRWDGGNGAVIAPMQVYTPSASAYAGTTMLVAHSRPAPTPPRPPPRPRLWNPPPPRILASNPGTQDP